MPAVRLRDGSEVADPRLDRIVSAVDWGVFDYPIRPALPRKAVAKKYRPRSYTHKVDHWLDQGEEGRCVEFSICHELLAKPAPVGRWDVDRILAAKAIYWPAQREDEWEGGSYPGASPVYEGTSVHAGMRVATRLGYFGEYRWAFNIEDLVLALGYFGPVVLGVNWYQGMFRPGADGHIRPTGALMGGHAILAQAVKIKYKVGTAFHWLTRSWEDVDLDRSYVVLWNSWGPGWGENGTCKISLRDLSRLLDEQGEACVPVRRVSAVVA